MYIAHIRESDKEEQLLYEHLLATAQQAAKFAESFGNSEYAYLCGLLHDIGKYSEKFQVKIKSKGNHRCDHSTAGAKEIIKTNAYGKLIAYCIAGHHSGLQNYGYTSDTGGEGTLAGRLADTYLVENYDEYKSEILDDITLKSAPNIKRLPQMGFSCSFLIRMLYSCLVDSDFLDTERFMLNGSVNRRVYNNFYLMLDKLNSVLAMIQKTDNIINLKRTQILRDCIESADSHRGLFTLTVPTGGGKTLSSMAFALNHLIRNNMRRIIYVIPFTSIIEQNAQVFSDIFGNEFILEHHSNFDFKDSEDDMMDQKKLSSENWDMPLIVTTNVQFFESLFANKSSGCRKLHNIANSVIIFDEVQMLPIEYLKPCTRAISELVYNYNCTAVLCSATQPALNEMFLKELSIKEICKNTNDLYDIFRRTKIVCRGHMDDIQVSTENIAEKQVLTIVNTRKHALSIFNATKGENSFHLSTLMCPRHRKATIDNIKKLLKQKEICRVVSTRLIEAGVDVDFPKVYRSETGLDSIIQSAGRCNREGKLYGEDGTPICGEVHVFKSEEKYIRNQPEDIKRFSEITDEIVRMFEDITSPQAIKTYFEKLYSMCGESGLDIKDIVNNLEFGIAPNSKPNNWFKYEFQSVAEKFRLIDDNTKTIVIPFDDEAVKLIEKLRFSEHISGILRSLQVYSVNIFENEYKALFASGKLDFVKDIAVLNSMSDYSMDTGLVIKIESGIGIFM